MNPEDVAALIEDGIEHCEATVERARGKHDDDHLRATVVSPAFDGLPLVQQHQLVYDALGDHMTRDIHALELKTYTPEEYDEL
ncbi:BolA family protein [Haloarchaeobius sp. TZWWS8]|uniref:BolA family protein n=1 Tax=Haloarchaeobius sp. TZWWS8 TaxID=3446121 RepID=UPI003EBB5135